MQEELHISVERAVQELLFVHGTVIIPDFGGFAKEYKPTGFDYVLGEIKPPSSTISFKENWKTDDGLLVEHLRRRNELSLMDAKAEVANFSRLALDKLSNKEIITIPSVGRIMVDFENKLKFIPDDTNFNPNSYGLPVLKYYPISRTTTQPAAAAAATAAPVPAAAPQKEKRSWTRLALPIIIGLALVAIPVTFYLTGSNTSTASANTNQNSEGRIIEVNDNTNISPKDKEAYRPKEATIPSEDEKEEENEYTPPPVDHTSLEDNEETAVTSTPPRATTPSVEKEEVSSSTDNRKYGVIIVGSFRKSSGINTMKGKIERAGLPVYTRRLPEGKTYVGVKYYKADEMDATLENVRRSVESGAWVYKKL